MKYYELKFTLSPCSTDAQDLLAALAGEAGCESFEETGDGLKAYVQQQLFDRDTLEQVIADFPFPDTHIIYKVAEAEDRDWNEQWEQEGFEPIVITGEAADANGESIARNPIIIHDGRHLPDAAGHAALTIEIDARQAFGTGTHETTRMICAQMLRLPLQGARVLDCGCGTGILGICALLLGADNCVAYDIDEWSADNTRHNAVINHVDHQLTVYCGDASLLGSEIGETFDVVMANINRNILLQDMPRFAMRMKPGGTLLLSGFYQADCPLLEQKGRELGLQADSISTDNDWAMMVFRVREPRD